MTKQQKKNEYLRKWSKAKREKDPIWIAKKEAIARKFDLIGQRFGCWEVILKSENRNGSSYWLCKCDCGTERVVSANSLRIGMTRSCGCKTAEFISKTLTTHGRVHTKEYNAWAGMKARCYNPKENNYYNYGGRGIIVCDRWLNSFENFFEDMGVCPFKNWSIDRIDVNGNYEKTNCRWASKDTQSNNTRRNVFVTCNGETLTIGQWTKKLSIDRSIWYRKKYRGIPKETIIEMFYKKVS